MEKEQGNARGTVEYYREDKGFGFVADSNGHEYFVHISDAQGETALRQGDRVVFDSYHTDRGMRAYSVRVKERGSVPPSESANRTGNKPRPRNHGSNRTQAGDRPSNTAGSKGRDDNRVECRSCGKRMIPRIITGPPKYAAHIPHRWTPVPLYSLCPLCGATHNKFDAHSEESTKGFNHLVITLVAFVLFASMILGSM